LADPSPGLLLDTLYKRPIGTADMALWIGGLTERPDHLQESAFDLRIWLSRNLGCWGVRMSPDGDPRFDLDQAAHGQGWHGAARLYFRRERFTDLTFFDRLAGAGDQGGGAGF